MRPRIVHIRPLRPGLGRHPRGTNLQLSSESWRALRNLNTNPAWPLWSCIVGSARPARAVSDFPGLPSTFCPTFHFTDSAPSQNGVRGIRAIAGVHTAPCNSKMFKVIRGRGRIHRSRRTMDKKTRPGRPDPNFRVLLGSGSESWKFPENHTLNSMSLRASLAALCGFLAAGLVLSQEEGAQDLVATSDKGVRYGCKCYPGDACWPATKEWTKLNKTVDGNLAIALPPGAPCHNTFNGLLGNLSTYNAAQCANATAKFTNEQWQ